jgi:hypothetical protein
MCDKKQHEQPAQRGSRWKSADPLEKRARSGPLMQVDFFNEINQLDGRGEMIRTSDPLLPKLQENPDQASNPAPKFLTTGNFGATCFRGLREGR